MVMLASETFQANRELDVTRAHDVLDLEVGELGIETELLDDSSIFAGSQLGVVFRFGTSDNHLSGSEDECSCLWVTDTHDDSGKTLWLDQLNAQTYHMVSFTLGLYSAFRA